MRWWLLVSFALIAACTKPNPRSCADGICNDPALPFCDVDGALEGIPETCIAVACTPGEFEACRGDQVIQCNGTGNDFDIVQCEVGCDAASNGCVTCSANAQCSNPTPICDLLVGQCVACVADDECASRVCNVDTGACPAESEVVYAAPTGGGAAACTLADPCSTTKAAMLASSNPLRSTVRLLPGQYSVGIDVIRGNAITLIGTGAALEATAGDALNVGAGASVTVRGLTIDLSRGLRCDGDFTMGAGAPALASLILSDLAMDMDATGSIANNCTFKLRRVNVLFTGTGGLGVGNATTLDIDRSRFANPDRLELRGIAGNAMALDVRIVNSVFEDVSISFTPQDPTAGQSRFFFAFNSLLMAGNNPIGALLGCSGNGTVLIENNVIARETGSSRNAADITGSCSANNNIFFPQMTVVPGTNRIVNPLFVDEANRNLRLQATSPGIDTAMASTGLDPSEDIEGTARPQGVASDLGAFELPQ